jgi:hypothetical protein
MPRRIKVTLNGQEVDAVEVDFSVQSEQWNIYELADGGRVKVKVSVAKIFRVLDAQGKPALDPEGDPVLALRHNTQVVASS